MRARRNGVPSEMITPRSRAALIISEPTAGRLKASSSHPLPFQSIGRRLALSHSTMSTVDDASVNRVHPCWECQYSQRLRRADRKQMAAAADVKYVAGDGRTGHHGFTDVIFAEQFVLGALGEHEGVAVFIGDVQAVRRSHRRAGKSS